MPFALIVLVLTVVVFSTNAQQLQLRDKSTNGYGMGTYSDYNNQMEPQIFFDPPDYTQHNVHSQFYVRVNLSASLLDSTLAYSKEGSEFFLGVLFDKSDQHLASMLQILRAPYMEYEFSKKYNLTYYLFWKVQTNSLMPNVDNEFVKAYNRSNHIFRKPSTGDNATNLAPKIVSTPLVSRRRGDFLITIANIGYPKIEIHLLEKKPNASAHVVHKETYHIRAIRKYRAVDLGFTIVITVIGILNVFAIGCMTKTPVLRSQLKKSIVPVCLASGTQYIITPLVRLILIHTFSFSIVLVVYEIYSYCKNVDLYTPDTTKKETRCVHCSTHHVQYTFNVYIQRTQIVKVI